MDNGKDYIEKLTFVMRREEARIKDKRLVVVETNPYICELKVTVNKGRIHCSAVILKRP